MTVVSPNFPTEGRPLTDPGNSGTQDAFVTILEPNSAIKYSSYLNIGYNEDGATIAVGGQGSIYVIGNTQINQSDLKDYVYLVKLIPSSLRENYWVSPAEIIGGSVYEWTYTNVGTVDATGNVYITGETQSPDFPGTSGALGGDQQAFIVKVSTSQLFAQLPQPSTVSTGSENSCSGISYNGTKGIVGLPVNTQTGAYEYTVKDISIPTSAGELDFQREYTSLSTNNSSVLSPGWTHNHNTRLILPGDPEGQPNTILFKANTANKYVFAINSNGTYSAYPGLCSTLVNEQGSYILKDAGQKTYTFDATGKLVSYADPEGHTWNYVYNTISGKLERINADGGAQYLLLHYDSQGRIDNVSDQTGRSVTYHYDSATGDLKSVDDVLGQTWSYEYHQYLPHLMTRVAAPGDVTVEETLYDTNYSPSGRVLKQYDGESNLIVELVYNADGTTTIKDRSYDANPETHIYDKRGTLRIQESSVGGQQQKQYDSNFRPDLITDPLENPTNLTWSNNGANLTHIEDALHHHTNIAYGDYNNPLEITDPLTYITKYFYNDPNFPTLPTRIEYPLSFDGGTTYIGTDYEYYLPSSGAAAGKVKLVIDASGHKTFYTYTSSGQLDTVTTAYQTTNAQTTDYDYDGLGRLVKVTDPAGVITHNKYDAAGRLTVTIRNVDPSTPNAENPPQNLVSGDNIYNLYTRYYYDTRGNQIAIVDTNWTITRTYYDLANRRIGEVQNLVINGTPATSDADVVTTIATPLASVPAYDPDHPDWNIRTEAEYDEPGNVIVTRDPQGAITRTYYDEANRPKLEIQNWAGVDLYGDISTAPSYNPAAPDQNVRIEYFYDLNNNLIATKDTLGVIARTYYDELNRPVTVVQNLTGQAISVATPPGRGTSSNVRTDTYYAANGNVIATMDPRGVITRTYYDAMNRPVTVVQNLSGQAIGDANPPAAGTEVNIRSDTYYDQAGNVIATVDPRGVVTRTYYDESNRPVTTVQNLVGQNIYVTAPPARSTTDQNVRMDIAYDQDGRRDTNTDPLGRVTKYEYDEVGQLLKTIANYSNGGTPQNDQDQRNIVTQYAYDALGRQTQTTDTLGRVTLNAYDDLGHVTSVTQNYLQGHAQNYKDASGDRYNLITTYAYDVRGDQIAVTDTAGVITRTYYDALARPVTVVRNLLGQDISIPAPPARTNPPSSVANLRTDTVYLGTGSVDSVIDEMEKTTDYSYDSLGRLITTLDPFLKSTSFGYDANGNRTSVTDGEGVVTKYEYDNLNRLHAVVENYRTGITPDNETNVRTEYTYDADGNRLSILDGNDHLTSFTYTALGQLETEADALGNTTTYDYNAMGNRLSLLDAKGATITYQYDELNRLALIDYPAPDADVTFDYDALGRRQSMGDGLGTTNWDYNNLDLPNSITDPFAASVAYDYDEVGNRTSLTYPDSSMVNYGYNDVNRLASVTRNQSAVASYQYDAAGRVKTVERANGVNTLYNYYDNGWLQDITHSSGITTLASYQYQYDNVGNRTQAIENVQNPQLASIRSNPLASNAAFGNASSGPRPQKALFNIAPRQVNFNRLPLSFVPNMGQFDQDVKFQANSLGGSIYFTSSEVVLALKDRKDKSKKDDDSALSAIDNSKIARIEYKNAEKNPIVAGINLQPGVANFMIGSDQNSWVANAPMYGGILYHDIYPGIDLTYEGTGNSLKSTFTVAAGADPALIQWKYKGASEVNRDAEGDLLVTLAAQEAEQTDTTLVEYTPVAWQEVNGQRQDVAVQYRLTQSGEISFAFPQGYDTSLPLIIDPTLTYSTYLGGIGTDVGTAITTDSSGNVYVTGYSWCGNFPITTTLPGSLSGSSEVIIAKISADGSTLLYSTCAGGSGRDYGASIALDTQGRVVVAGGTQSTDFPIVSGIATYGGDTGICTVDAPCQDNFILALNADGSAIRYSTYLGGDGREEPGGIAVDANGKILLAGFSTSTNFPTVNAYDSTYATGGTCSSATPCYDVTVTKIDPELTGTAAILYSTYLGGIERDRVFGMTLDPSGRVYLIGSSYSDDYPTRNALQSTRKGSFDVIVTQVDPSLSGDASLLYSTYFGTTLGETGYSIARDASGSLYLTGRTQSSKFPLRDPLQYASHAGTCGTTPCYEAFVTKLDISTNTLIYSTYLGGSQNDEGNGIAVDAYGRAYVAGFTRSSDFPTSNPIQATKGADGCTASFCADAFLSVLEPDGRAFAYSTFLGGNQDDIANGMTLDSANSVYLVGETYSTNFPTTPGAYDVINTETDKRDAFIAKVSALGAPPAQPDNHLDASVAAGSDDAEESASGTVSLTSTDLELVRDSNNQTVGMRFAGVNIPQGATIVNASVQFVVDEATSETTTLTFQAQASDNAPTFTATANNISSRPRTTASVPWTPAAWNTLDQAGPDQRTPNLAPVIQEMVDRPGWAAGHAIAILVTGTGKRVARSYEEDMYAAPYLHIEYTLPPSGQLGLQITPNPTSFTGSGQSIGYTYTLTNTGDVPLNGPYLVSDDKVSSVDCSAATSPLAIGANTTCVGSYTTTAADVTAGSIVNSATATASDGVGTITSNVATATVTLQIPSGPITINYVYDPLYRLKEANYSNDDYYHYTYDAVGNRLQQISMVGGLSSTVDYVYDAANRLASVNGVTYTWDNNGNLLNDGVNTYTYDAANRMISSNGQGINATYAYTGLGDRIRQTVNGNTTTYTLDLNAGLTQVLNDGMNTYLYGMGRIAQENTGTEYFLGDALNSTRQLTNASAQITLAQSYDPFGNVLSHVGSSQSIYGYTSEQMDPSGLVYLRARYYSSGAGRFTSRDTWDGDYNRPLSLNRWMYVEGNPINHVDPSGMCIRPDGSVDFWGWPWGSRWPCKTNTSGSVTTTPTTPALIITAIACPTPTSTNTPTSTPTMPPASTSTPTPFQNLDQYFASLPEPYAKLPSKMSISDAGLAFIKKWEHFYGQLYNDGNKREDKYFFDRNGRGKGNCTIGYGYRVHSLPCNQYPTEDRFKNGISEQEGVRLLREQINIKAEVWIRSYVTVRLTQTQYDALASLYYNWGGDRIVNNPEKLQLLNSGQYVATANHIRSGPVTSGGVYFESLQRRRNEEADMFLLPVSFSAP